MNTFQAEPLIDDQYGPIAPPTHLKQLKCFEVAKWVNQYALKHGGNTPSINKIAKRFAISNTAVVYHLDLLRSYGLAVRIDEEFVLVGSCYQEPEWLK